MTGAARSPRQTARYLFWRLSAVCSPRVALVVFADAAALGLPTGRGRHRLLDEVPGDPTSI